MLSFGLSCVCSVVQLALNSEKLRVLGNGKAFFWSQEFNTGVTVSYLHVNSCTSRPETEARERRAQRWVEGGGGPESK